MTDLSPEQREALYPADCHIKIIGESNAALMPRIQGVLTGLSIDVPVSEGNHSAQGRYVTYNLSLRVETLQRMEEIDAALRAIDGVRMVL